MSYIIPQIKQFKCKKCGHEQERDVAQRNTLLFELYCIKCFETFLDENIGKIEEK